MTESWKNEMPNPEFDPSVVNSVAEAEMLVQGIVNDIARETGTKGKAVQIIFNDPMLPVKGVNPSADLVCQFTLGEWGDEDYWTMVGSPVIGGPMDGSYAFVIANKDGFCVWPAAGGPLYFKHKPENQSECMVAAFDFIDAMSSFTDKHRQKYLEWRHENRKLQKENSNQAS